MTKVLITGGSGLLGKSLYETKPEDIELIMTYHRNRVFNSIYHMDITDKREVNDVIYELEPEIIIHCAAEGSVEIAEKNPIHTTKVNVNGTKNIVNAAQNIDALVVYISSNAVYTGDNPPYNEKSQLIPVNMYGVIKREAEREIIKSDKWIIVRPFLLYGYPLEFNRTNWFCTILENLELGKETLLVNDIFWQHTNSIDVAKAIWKIIGLSLPNEIYNVAQPNILSLYEFGVMVGELWNYEQEKIDEILKEVSIDFFEIAPRPKNTEFDLTKLHNLLGHSLPNVKEGLQDLK